MPSSLRHRTARCSTSRRHRMTIVNDERPFSCFHSKSTGDTDPTLGTHRGSGSGLLLLGRFQTPHTRCRPRSGTRQRTIAVDGTSTVVTKTCHRLRPFLQKHCNDGESETGHHVRSGVGISTHRNMYRSRGEQPRRNRNKKVARMVPVPPRINKAPKAYATSTQPKAHRSTLSTLRGSRSRQLDLGRCNRRPP